MKAGQAQLGGAAGTSGAHARGKRHLPQGREKIYSPYEITGGRLIVAFQGTVVY
jgi:hypothetical protein